MAQRNLLITAVAVVGLAAVLYGPHGVLAISLPLLGVLSLPGRGALAAASVLAVYFGATSGRATWRAALPPTIFTLGVFLAVATVDVQPVCTDAGCREALAALAVVLPVMLAVQSPAGGAGSRLLIALRDASVYVAAPALFFGVFSLRLPVAVTVALTGLAAALLATASWGSGEQVSKAGPRKPSFIVGIVVAQATWPLLLWSAPLLLAALALAAIFYTGAGLMDYRYQGARQALEYAAVGSAALMAIALAALRLA
jgi:hypothetical protein